MIFGHLDKTLNAQPSLAIKLPSFSLFITFLIFFIAYNIPSKRFLTLYTIEKVPSPIISIIS